MQISVISVISEGVSVGFVGVIVGVCVGDRDWDSFGHSIDFIHPLKVLI